MLGCRAIGTIGFRCSKIYCLTVIGSGVTNFPFLIGQIYGPLPAVSESSTIKVTGWSCSFCSTSAWPLIKELKIVELRVFPASLLHGTSNACSAITENILSFHTLFETASAVSKLVCKSDSSPWDGAGHVLEVNYEFLKCLVSVPLES